MHEVAIIRRVLEIAESEARREEASRITLIKVRIGEFRGVVAEALEFAFDVLRQGTMAEAARLEVETVPLRLSCAGCGEYGSPPGDLNLFCPGCGMEVDVISGRELEVDYIEVG